MQAFLFPTGIVVPILIVLGSIIPAGNQYNIHSFPPLRCLNQRGEYYNFVLPLNVIISTANTLLVIIGWVIHKVSYLSNKAMKWCLPRQPIPVCLTFLFFAAKGTNSWGENLARLHLLFVVFNTCKLSRCTLCRHEKFIQGGCQQLLSLWSSGLPARKMQPRSTWTIHTPTSEYHILYHGFLPACC